MIDEVRDFGLEMLKIAKEKVPYYKKAYTEFDKMIEKARQMDMTGNFYKKKNQ